MGQLMWYTTREGPDVENVTGGLEVLMNHRGTENWKGLVLSIVYI